MKISKNDSDSKVHTLSGHNVVGGKMIFSVSKTVSKSMYYESLKDKLY